MPSVSWSPFDVPWPAPDRDIRRLLPNANGKTGFESYAAAERERSRRVASLRRHRSPLAAQTAERLSACAAGARCLSSACSTCVGPMRIWFYSEAAATLGIGRMIPQSTQQIITLVHEDWIVPKRQIVNFDPQVLIDRVRHQFSRAGVGSAIVIGAVHGEFDNQRQYWRPHLHLAARDLEQETILLLRQRHYQRSPLVYRPMVVQRLRDPAPQISYLLKSYWPLRERYIGLNGKEFSTFKRIPEPSHSQWLILQNQFNLFNFVFLLGARRQRHHLVPFLAG